MASPVGPQAQSGRDEKARQQAQAAWQYSEFLGHSLEHIEAIHALEIQIIKKGSVHIKEFLRCHSGSRDGGGQHRQQQLHQERHVRAAVSPHSGSAGGL